MEFFFFFLMKLFIFLNKTKLLEHYLVQSFELEFSILVLLQYKI